MEAVEETQEILAVQVTKVVMEEILLLPILTLLEEVAAEDQLVIMVKPVELTQQALEDREVQQVLMDHHKVLVVGAEEALMDLALEVMADQEAVDQEC